MAVLHIDGFDKYGPINQNNPTVINLLTAGEYTSAGGVGTIGIVAPLSATGAALNLTEGSLSTMTVYKNLGTTYNRFIGGFRFQSNLIGLAGFTATYITNDQWSVFVNSVGAIVVTTGGSGGTQIGIGGTISANSIHYLEFDVTVGSSAAFHIWLDGVSIISGTGNTAGAGGTHADGFQLNNSYEYQSMTFDDFYLFDNTGSTNNAVLLTSPRVETTFPTGDNKTTFTNGGSVLGQDYTASPNANANAPGANTLFLRQFTPAVNVTLNSVTCFPASTSVTANFKAVVYSDNSGSPHTLLSSGTQVTGCTAGTQLTGNLVTPQSLTGSTSYWLGFISDTAINLYEVNSTITGQVANNTYTSGAPSTAPSMTANQPSWQIFGNCTGATTNWTSELQNPSAFDSSYVYSNTVGAEDLYTFTGLTQTPSAIYTVGVKGFMRKTDTGARTADLKTKSGTTDLAGSNSNIAPATSYGWLDSYFDTDPNTSAAWTEAGLNAAVSGPQVAS